MREILELIILDFHRRLREGELPDPIPREAHLPFFPQKVNSVIGIRRAGKTWFCFQKIRELCRQGIPPEYILYINFEDERLLPFSTRNLALLLRVYQDLYPDTVGKRCYFFLDEIQNVPGWELFVRRISEQEHVQVTLTGSSAKLLSKEIASSLRGRSFPVEVFPLSFREFLRFNKVEITHPLRIDSRLRARLANLFKEYMKVGGFPEIQAYSDLDRLYMLQEYCRSIIFRDIVERYAVSNILALKQIIGYMLQNSATLFSVNKLFRHLKSLGIKVDKNFVYQAVDYLQDVYFAFLVPKFVFSEKARQINPSKLYLIDQALVLSHLKAPSPDLGRLLENIIFLELRRHPFALEYYRSKKVEVDFLVRELLSGRRVALQVCLSLKKEKTVKREFSALREVTQKGFATSGFLITLDEKEADLERQIEPFRVISAWRFCLDPKKYLFEGN